LNALIVAFVHLLFNISGIMVVAGIPLLRGLPVSAAKRMAELSQRSRWLPIVYILTVFYLLPLVLILLLR
jgi:sodium-dependent phosphate cotransporter